MRAAVVDGYGPPEVVRVAQVAEPRPRKRDVLVRVHATTVSSGDARIRGARFPRGTACPARLALGVRRPRRPRLGGPFSGVVTEVGAAVTDLAPGDEVCGSSGLRMGAHAEVVAAAAKGVVARPTQVGHVEAAGLFFGGCTALHFLRRLGEVARRDTVLINGASGAVGTIAVQLARHDGAEVTAVCSSAHADLVTALGADRVIDYATHPLSGVTDRFDLVLDTVGNLAPADASRLLTHDGVLLLATADLPEMLRARGNVRVGMSPERPEDFRDLLDLVADGDLTVALEEVLDLADIVAAHRLVDSRHKAGAVVVRP